MDQSPRNQFLSNDSPTPAPRDERAKRRRSSREDFTEPTTNAQFKLPADLITSLKLHSFQSGKTMSDIVLECLTSTEMVQKAWISTRKQAG